MPLHVTESSGTKVYNLSAGKTLPEWLSSKKKKSLKQDEEYRGRIELIQDLDFPTTTQGLKFSRDGNFIAAVGNYPPQVKVYELSELSMKFNRYLDCDCVSFEILSDDFSKLVFLHADRTVEFHAKFGAYYKTRVPKAGRDMLLVPNTCDLVVGGSSSHLYRLNLEQGRFLAPFETSLPAVNSLVHSPELGLLLAGGEDGLLECWDPRCRRRASVLDVRTSERSFDVGSDVTALAVAGCGSLQCAVGTSGGYTLVYDLRSSVPLLCKDQMFGLPIRRVRFHNVEGQRHIISADSKIIKVWSSSEVSAAPLVSMEPPSDINDFAVQDNTGLVMVSCEMPRVQCLFVPALGPAPKWCSLLGSLTEELEETAQSAVYDDYKFVTTQELDALNLSHMIGTAMLRPYMHGFFMDARLHARSKAAANPFEYEEYRKSKIRAKIEEKTKGRIVNRGALAAGNKVSVNQELVDKITREQEEESKSEGRGRKKKIKGTGHLLQDDRFAALFRCALQGTAAQRFILIRIFAVILNSKSIPLVASTRCFILGAVSLHFHNSCSLRDARCG
jgi:ribosome biogenesis protein ENP2